MPLKTLVFRNHAIKRMFEREITVEDVRKILLEGEIIENYADDSPFPSYLILGKSGGRPIHIVAADNEKRKETIVITVYEPHAEKWEPDFERRKK